MAKQASRMAARHGGIQPRTWARGVVTTHSYNGWNGLTNTAMAEVRADAYGYNARNELISGTKSGGSQSPATEYEYSYDDIGNRLTSLDLGTNRTYVANSLNQYTLVGRVVPNAPQEEFAPQFDLDGNQALVKTSTGVWSVTYSGYLCAPNK